MNKNDTTYVQQFEALLMRFPGEMMEHLANIDAGGTGMDAMQFKLAWWKLRRDMNKFAEHMEKDVRPTLPARQQRLGPASDPTGSHLKPKGQWDKKDSNLRTDDLQS